jgi:hypothetical protein
LLVLWLMFVFAFGLMNIMVLQEFGWKVGVALASLACAMPSVSYFRFAMDTIESTRLQNVVGAAA